MYIINTLSHDFSRAIWNKQALVHFFKDHKLHSPLWARAILLVFEKIYSCVFIPNCTRNHVITYTNLTRDHCIKTKSIQNENIQTYPVAKQHTCPWKEQAALSFHKRPGDQFSSPRFTSERKPTHQASDYL